MKHPATRLILPSIILIVLLIAVRGGVAMKPQPRRHHTSVCIAGKDYVFGGYTGVGHYNDLWEYDPTTNKWARKADSPLEGRSGHLATAHNGKMYVFGGATISQAATKDLLEYDPSTNKWAVINNAPIGMSTRNHGSGAINGNKWYVFAGHSAIAGVENDLNDLWEYDFTAQAWAQLATNAYRRSAQTAAFYNNKMYSFGGDSNQPSDAPISVYNPATNTWEERTAAWGYIHKASAVTYGDYIYVYAGNSPSNTNAMRKYNPADNTYSLEANGVEAVNSTAIVLDNGIMRVFGGNNFDDDGLSDLHYGFNFSSEAWFELYNFPLLAILRVKTGNSIASFPMFSDDETSNKKMKLSIGNEYRYLNLIDAESTNVPALVISTPQGLMAVQGILE